MAQADGVRVCHGGGTGPTGSDLRLKSFDGTPLALYVTLPPAPASGPDGAYPLIIQSHGWGDPPTGPDDAQYGGPTARQWAKEGYAVVQLAARGWGESCGTINSRLLYLPGCMNGYVRRDDFRYEIRDAQYLAGLLVDEGIADRNRIGAQGESYGAGASLGLATLNDRVMNLDGSLSPWTSPKGAPLHIAAAAPFAGWGDDTALAPHGWLTAQDTATNRAAPVGVQKMSDWGRACSTVGIGRAPTTPARWRPRHDHDLPSPMAGEPYDRCTQILLDAQEPGPSSTRPTTCLSETFGTAQAFPQRLLLLTNGFTDDVFWADQVLVYYNRLRALYPSAPVQVLFGDIGHQRAQSKPADLAVASGRIHAFLAYYLKGAGTQPAMDVTALTQTCPIGAPSGGPYTAPTWAALHPGTVSFASKPTQTILSTGGDPKVSQAFDPVSSGLLVHDQRRRPMEVRGVATYRPPTPTGAGLHPARIADHHRRPEGHRRVRLHRGPAGRRGSRDQHQDPWSPARTIDSIPRRRTGARPSSYRPTAGVLRPATSRSSSCWAATPPSCGLPTGPSRLRSRTWSCGCPPMRPAAPTDPPYRRACSGRTVTEK